MALLQLCARMTLLVQYMLDNDSCGLHGTENSVLVGDNCDAGLERSKIAPERERERESIGSWLGYGVSAHA